MKKKGRVERPNWLISGFRQAVQDAGLVDIPMEGYVFTWFKSLSTARAVEKKLDRAMANNAWCGLFPNAKMKSLPATTSDHYPIFLCCDPPSAHVTTRKVFRFENAWLMEPGFSDFVHEQWLRHGEDYDSIMKKLEACGDSLLHWSKNNSNKTRIDIESISRKLNIVRQHVEGDNFNYFTALKHRLNSLLKKPSSRDQVLQAINTSITTEDNNMLTIPFVITEFKDAIFSMQADKSPGRDGFNFGFYHQFWDICGVKIFNASCLWLESAKVLANRLKRVLDKCISDNQSAFVPGRSILDNAMAAIEKWIGWIMLCVETVDYSVGVNGNMVGPIVPGRGLRQGDPLSPAAISEANMMKNILTTYEEVSGQAINFQKSEFYCSRNVDSGLRNLLAGTLGLQQELGTGKYLGVPSMIGRNRKATFKFIKDRIWKKINSWSSRSLSQAGRETLIKSVLQSIPTYIMSIFLLPSSLIDEIEKMSNSFWWGHTKDNSSIHWLSWDKLSMPKKFGGMGFKNLSAFNYSMLSKQAWSLMTKPNTLVSRLYKARYFPKCDFLNSEIGHNPSYVWRSIWSAKFVVRGGNKWSIGTGGCISVWDQNWLYDSFVVTNLWPNNLMVANLKVSDLINPTCKQWKLNLIYPLVGGEVAQKIANTPLFEAVHEDRVFWNLEKNGIFSVRSAYRYCVNEAIDTSHLRINKNWDLIWNMKIPPRVKNFLWRLCRNCVPTRTRLIDKGVGCPDSCVIYGNGYENNNHLYFQCPKSIVYWEKVGLWQTIQQLVNNGGDFSSVVFSFLQVSTHENQAVFSTILWSIWKSRNNALWNQIEDSPDNICLRARTEWFSPITDVDTVEALGLLAAINWVLDLGYDNVVFESDSKSVVDSVTIHKPNDSDFGTITRVCYQVLTHSTRNFQIKFIRRQANEVAHALAKATPSLASFHIFNDKLFIPDYQLCRFSSGLSSK
ncbi:uncharacterized protein LOC131615213 [Vicia villosa]|uniref:uncharacterized protein LOC131615213 n=1 Tax=Vicia villosa TaxID=3911 RepID=UPI00273AA3D9|nr:uncharacterized protein LOC131615213 [Vicia villosa]